MPCIFDPSKSRKYDLFKKKFRSLPVCQLSSETFSYFYTLLLNNSANDIPLTTDGEDTLTSSEDVTNNYTTILP